MYKRFSGEDAYEDFGMWTDDVNLEHGEITEIVIKYDKSKD